MLEAISAQDIAVSGLKAQRTRINVIANNIANALTTRTRNNGGAYRRQVAILEAENLEPFFSPSKFGVKVSRIVRDPSPLRTVYDPGHPDADKNGYVQ